MLALAGCRAQIWKSSFLGMNVWMPHSTLLNPVQRPARSSSPLPVRRVQGWQPIDPIAPVVQGVVGNLVCRAGNSKRPRASSWPSGSASRCPGPRPRRTRTAQSSRSPPACSDCCRRRPVIQQSRSHSLSRSGSTLRMVQQRSGLRSHSSGPLMSACSSTVRSGSSDSIFNPKKSSSRCLEREGLGKKQAGVQGEDRERQTVLAGPDAS